MALVYLAGLSDTVKVEIGSSDASLKRLHASGHFTTKIDLMFLDHYKPAYTTDLKLCEELGLVSPGSVLAADNVIKPGNPPYLEYVRSSVETKREKNAKAKAKKKEANGDINDIEAFADRAVQQYKKRIEKEELGVAVGNPNLVYESQLVNSFEPTGVPDGVEISRCVGEEEK